VSSSGTILPSFFVIGGTLPRDAACYIRRDADERLYSSLCTGDICYALTPRQMGKSSLMVQTAARLRKRGASVALLDLTALGQNLTPDQWYNGLIGRIGQQLDLEDELESFWNARLHVGPFQRFASAIRDVVLKMRKDRVVIFIDEIDAVRSLPFSTDEFFAGIREFFNRRTVDPELCRLTFCLLGVATPSDLIRDTRTTPFNIGVRVELSDFTVEEASPLAQGLFMDAKKGQQLIGRVLYWTGGHPYLTQRLCQAISKDGAPSPADVDRVCNELFLSHRARERDDNLLFVRERMLRNEADLAALLLLYGKVRSGARVRDDETNPLVAVLRLAGIVRVEGGYLRVRNRIYSEVFDKDWVAESLPGAEMRRQRAAYSRGFRIAGAVFVPLVLLGAFGVYYEFRTNTTPPPAPIFDEKPPAFWASFSSQTMPTGQSGALLIKSGDAGISVLVNNALYGHTEKGGSLEIPVLPAGDYEVRLEKPGFQAVSQRAQVVPDRETRLSFKLSPLTQVAIDNLLFITQTPAGTKVTVDDKVAGITNAEGELSLKVVPGEHDILLEHAGYLPRSLKRPLNVGRNVLEGSMQPDMEGTDLDTALRSNDAAKLREFLSRYPSSKAASQIRGKIEDLEWSKVQDSNDPNQLQAFIDRYPNGKHFAEASRLSDQIVADDVAWRSTMNSSSVETVRSFLEKYPRSRHAGDARSLEILLTDQADISKLLHDYEDSYNHRDVGRLMQIWPACPTVVQSLLKNEQTASSVTLSMKSTVAVKGSSAAVQVIIKKPNSTKTVLFTFKKQNDHWIIDTGSL